MARPPPSLRTATWITRSCHGSRACLSVREALARVARVRARAGEISDTNADGRARNEWSRLAHWFMRHGLDQLHDMRFMIQMPRLFAMLRNEGSVASFAELIRNMFEPLFLARGDCMRARAHLRAEQFAVRR